MSRLEFSSAATNYVLPKFSATGMLDILNVNVGVVAGFLVVHLKYTLAIASICSILFKSNESLSPLYTMKELTNNLHKNILPL